MADNNVRQRRGKKSTSGAADSESTANNKDTAKPTPSKQLKNAQARLIVSRDRTADLHTAWR